MRVPTGLEEADDAAEKLILLDTGGLKQELSAESDLVGDDGQVSRQKLQLALLLHSSTRTSRFTSGEVRATPTTAWTMP